MPSASYRALNVRSVAIIGAGPSGIAALKYLRAEQKFDRIDIFEQRETVGGVWDYDSPSKTTPKDFQVPHTEPRTGLSQPTWTSSGIAQVLGDKVKQHAQFLSPLYDNLETNIPRTLMGFSDLDWPKDSQLFPKHETVTQYIEDYAKDVHDQIQFRTQVVKVTPIASNENPGSGWRVATKRIGTDDINEDVYDAVVAAIGHFNVPYVPKINGLKEFSQRYPNAISHSMYYKNPQQYKDKKVICVGSGPSALDIGRMISSSCKWPLIQSQRSLPPQGTEQSPGKQVRPEIAEFITDKRAVRFADGSIEEEVDHVLFCTGYFYSFPFLEDLSPPLIDDGTHVLNTYQHLFYRRDPTLVFPVLQQRIIPFPMSEVQAAVYARVWSGRLTLPSDAEMKAWEDDLCAETNGGRSFHLLPFPKDGEYINMMHDFAMSADEGQTKGKRPPRWDDEAFWIRERVPTIKAAFQGQGEERHHIISMEQLGFEYGK